MDDPHPKTSKTDRKEAEFLEELQIKREQFFISLNTLVESADLKPKSLSKILMRLLSSFEHPDEDKHPHRCKLSIKMTYEVPWFCSYSDIFYYLSFLKRQDIEKFDRKFLSYFDDAVEILIINVPTITFPAKKTDEFIDQYSSCLYELRELVYKIADEG